MTQERAYRSLACRSGVHERCHDPNCRDAWHNPNTAPGNPNTSPPAKPNPNTAPPARRRR